MTLVTTKGPDAFRTISEASDELGVPTHVLRFWETKFSFIRPMKRAGGRRFYRPRDLDVLKGVRDLLHEEGYTIKGVQRLHKEQGLGRLLSAGGASAEAATATATEFDSDGSNFDEDADVSPEQGVARPARPLASGEGNAQPPAPRPMLTELARTRLEAILDDLHRAKSAIDALLHADANDVA